MSESIAAYRKIAENRFREVSGLYYEDFEIGNTYEHRPGRTITDVDNIWTTLLTMNTQQCTSTRPTRVTPSGRRCWWTAPSRSRC